MFTTRLISGAVLVALTLLLGILGGPVLAIVNGVIAVIGMFELYRAFGIENERTALIGYLGAAVLYIFLIAGRRDLVLMAVILTFLCMMALYVFRFPKIETAEVLEAFFGFFYAGVLLSYLCQTRMAPDGKYTLWLIYLSAWGCDTSAYCVGKLFGKHHMTPELSPHKTIEGAVGGICGAALFCLIYGLLVRDQLIAFEHPVFSCVLVGAVGALISMIGDLAASAVKRKAGIKDYGHLIPGHGGIMDRFDSIAFTAPVIYWLVVLLQA